MRKLNHFLSLIILTVFLISCDKDKDVEPASNLIGEWNLSTVNVIVNDIVIPVESAGIENLGFNSLKYNFTSDNTLIYEEEDYSFEGTYEFDPITGTLIVLDDEDYTYNYLASVTNDELKLSTITIDPANLENLDEDSEEAYIFFTAVFLLAEQELSEEVEALEATSMKIEYNFVH